jgi:hypothetical protein
MPSKLRQPPPSQPVTLPPTWLNCESSLDLSSVD